MKNAFTYAYGTGLFFTSNISESSSEEESSEEEPEPVKPAKKGKAAKPVAKKGYLIYTTLGFIWGVGAQFFFMT